MSELDRAAQRQVAVEVALATIRRFESEPGAGRLQTWRVYDDRDGSWLEVVFRSLRHAQRRVFYSRVIWPTHPDKDPETSGMIYGSAFQERLLTGQTHTKVDSEDDDLTL